jgi:hypothetical protein
LTAITAPEYHVLCRTLVLSTMINLLVSNGLNLAPERMKMDILAVLSASEVGNRKINRSRKGEKTKRERKTKSKKKQKKIT